MVKPEASPEFTKEVRAERFVVCDWKGQELGRIESVHNGAFLEFKPAAGPGKLALGVADGAASLLLIASKGQQGVVTIKVHAGEGGATIAISTANSEAAGEIRRLAVTVPVDGPVRVEQPDSSPPRS